MSTNVQNSEKRKNTYNVGTGAAQVRHLEVREVAEGGGPGSVQAARLPPAPATEHLQHNHHHEQGHASGSSDTLEARLINRQDN